MYAHLRKERFPIRTSNKLKFKNIGSCKILKNISGSAYALDFPRDLGISSTFNVSNLYKHEEGSMGGIDMTKDWCDQ